MNHFLELFFYYTTIPCGIVGFILGVWTFTDKEFIDTLTIGWAILYAFASLVMGAVFALLGPVVLAIAICLSPIALIMLLVKALRYPRKS